MNGTPLSDVSEHILAYFLIANISPKTINVDINKYQELSQLLKFYNQKNTTMRASDNLKIKLTSTSSCDIRTICPC